MSSPSPTPSPASPPSETLTFMQEKTQQRPVIVDKVSVDGLTFTSPDVVTFAGKPIFDATNLEELLIASKNAAVKLQRLGIFKSVNVSLDTSSVNGASSDPSSPQHVDVVLTVQEGSRLQGTSGIVVGNSEADFQIGATLKNAIFRRAEKLSLYYSVGLKYPAYHLTFTQPVGGDPDKLVSVSVQATTQNHQAQSNYSEGQKGVDVAYTAKSEYGWHKVSYECQWRTVFDVPRQASMKIREQAGHSLKSSIKHILTSDTRDDVHMPREGRFFELTTEIAGLGGDVQFVKNAFQSQIFKSFFGGNITLAGSLWGGLLKSWSTSQSHVADRFYLGGPNSVRGFALRGVGPRDKNSALGGDAYLATGLHVYSTIPWKSIRESFGRNLMLHGFANAGNISLLQHGSQLAPQLASLLHPLESRICIGLGLVLRTSQARLEINYCKPYSSLSSDNPSRGWQFGLGVTFL